MAVIGGICHSALARLSKTNLHLSLEDQKVNYLDFIVLNDLFYNKFWIKILNDYMELLSSNFNYGMYRKTMSEIQGFNIPIM